jgi:putative transposase
MQIAHKTELKSNNTQATYFRKACGVRRMSWNWGLAEWNRQYSEQKKPSGMSLKKRVQRTEKDTLSIYV